MTHRYGHDPQDYRALDEVRSARIFGAEEGAPEELVGVGHGAVGVELVAHGVRVANRCHYFCRSSKYEIVAGNPLGDGTPIPEDTPCRIAVERVPDDGVYDAHLRIVNNNGSIDMELIAWLRPNSREEVPVTSRVKGMACV